MRGGALVDPRLPRVTVLARGSRTGLSPGAGWAALCRLVTDTHLRGSAATRRPLARLLAEHSRAADAADAAGPVRAGTAADTGAARDAERPGWSCSSARLRRRPCHAARSSPSPGPLSSAGRPAAGDALVVEIVCHGGPEHLPGSLGQAGRMFALPAEPRVPTVITAAVRHADPQDAAIVDVLDAARRWSPLTRATSTG